MPTAFIIGCGFVGEVAADFLFQNSWDVHGACGTSEAAQRLAHKPYSVKVCDVSQPADLRLFSERQPDAVLFCASSRGGNEEAYRNLYLNGARNILDILRPTKFIFTSSTSLYAQTLGEIVDEQSPTEPTRSTGGVLLETEKIVLSSGGTVARLAAVYGPARSVLMRKFLTGEALLEEGGRRWINQIHREDAARALAHLIHAPAGVYNVCDDRPATQREVYQWLANFFRRPLPPEGPANLHRKRGWSSKRVSNQKLRSLHWAPHWKSYENAIPAISSTIG